MALATKPKPNAQHKKRQAQHHRQSKHYLKAYWPYLPMLMIVAVGFVINSAWSHGNVLGASSNFSSASLLSSTNADRANDHEQPLSIDSQLTAAAQAKANDMVKNNYWAHTSPSGKTPWDFITAAGYDYQEAGENLAYGFNTGADVEIGWMNSTEHRANILNADYQNVGFGVASSPNYQGSGPETVVVAEYAEPTPAAANITFTVPNPAAPTANVKGDSTELSAQPVSRIQLLTGGKAAWMVAGVSALTGAALALFIVRHGLRLRRLLVKGEVFVAHHAMLDIAVVFIFTAGFVLTRSSGIIR